jgi:ADP-ribose pyrophosphatase YjhB (NUDIX family)
MDQATPHRSNREQVSPAIQPTLPPKQQFLNSTPVVVAVVPVVDDSDPTKPLGLLVVRRGIDPFKGKLALPGGFLEHEEWRAGLVRELREETGIELTPADVREDVALESVQNGTRLLIFAHTKPVAKSALGAFKPCKETQELVVIHGPEELAFPTHTEHARRFFARVV